MGDPTDNEMALLYRIAALEASVNDWHNVADGRAARIVELEAEFGQAQEPVAWVCKTNNGTLYLEWPEMIEPSEEWTKVSALFTAPQPRAEDAKDASIGRDLVRHLKAGATIKAMDKNHCVEINDDGTIYGGLIFNYTPPSAEDAKDAARYRWLRDNGQANEKRESKAVLPRGGKKATVAFRYWTTPEDLDGTIDQEIERTHNAGIHRAAEGRPVERLVMQQTEE